MRRVVSGCVGKTPEEKSGTPGAASRFHCGYTCVLANADTHVRRSISRRENTCGTTPQADGRSGNEASANDGAAAAWREEKGAAGAVTLEDAIARMPSVVDAEAAIAPGVFLLRSAARALASPRSRSSAASLGAPVDDDEANNVRPKVRRAGRRRRRPPAVARRRPLATALALQAHETPTATQRARRSRPRRASQAATEPCSPPEQRFTRAAWATNSTGAQTSLRLPPQPRPAETATTGQPHFRRQPNANDHQSPASSAETVLAGRPPPQTPQPVTTQGSAASLAS
jgi:hypothetical protein